MKRQNFLILFFLIMAPFHAFALGVGGEGSSTNEKNVNGRFVKKISSLTLDKSNSKTFSLADFSDGFRVEIERKIQGFAGPVLEKDVFQSKFKAGVGIDFTAGLTFVNSKDVKTMIEAEDFAKNNPLDYFQARRAIEMIPNESAHFDFYAGLVLSPQAKNLGIIGMVTGGWDVIITKKLNNVVEINFALISTKLSSIYFDKWGAMLSLDMAHEFQNGFTLSLNLNDVIAQKAYEKIFMGNIEFSQEHARKNKSIIFKTNSSSSKVTKGVDIWVRTPIVAWFLLNCTQHLTEGEKDEYNYQTNVQTNSINSSFEAETQLDFLGLYYGSNRIFRGEFNENLKSYNLSETYEIEGTNGKNMSKSIDLVLKNTRLDDYFDLDIPEIRNQYYYMKFEVSYSENVLKHLISGLINLDQMRLQAEKSLNKFYDKKLKTFYDGSNHSESIYNVIQDKQSEEQMIYIAVERIEKHSELMHKAFLNHDNKSVLDNFSIMMKYIYRSPEIYKQFFEISKHCGLEVNYEINSQVFAKKVIHQIYQKDSTCSE